MALRDKFKERLRFREGAVTTIEPIDLFDFIFGEEYLHFPTLFPSQSLALKLYYRVWDKHPFTEAEEALIKLERDKWGIDYNLEGLRTHWTQILSLPWGRRSGKSAVVAGIILTYEIYKLICLGNPHKHYGILQGDTIYLQVTAAKEEQAVKTFSLGSKTAKACKFFEKYIDSRKDLETELRFCTPYDLLQQQQVQEWNASRPRGVPPRKLPLGSIVFWTTTTSGGTSRGGATIVQVFEEFAQVRRARKNAEDEPTSSGMSDYELYKALAPSTKTFGKAGKVIEISSPREEGGEFYAHYKAGTGDASQKIPGDPHTLVVQFATWEANPNIKREDLQPEFDKDPLGASQEYGAEFGKPAASFIQLEKLNAMVIPDRHILLQGSLSHRYAVALDPASRSDTYACGWGHAEKQGDQMHYYIDGLMGWRPRVEKGTDGSYQTYPIDHGVVLDFVAGLCTKALARRILVIAYDQYQCLTEDAVLFTDKGMQTIRELVSAGTPLQVGTKEGKGTATHFYDNGVRRVKELRTKFGYSLTGTFNHPVWTESGWKLLQDIRVGEKVAIRPTRMFGEVNTISPARAKLYGYIASEGYCYKDLYVEFSNIDPEILHDFDQTVTQELGYKSYSMLRNKRYLHCLSTRGAVVDNDLMRVSSKAFTRECIREGIAGTSFTKRVPESVRKGTKEVVTSFLSALYEGDGSVGGYVQQKTRYRQLDYYVVYVTRSKQLADDVHLLLLNLGIITSKTSNMHEGALLYRLTTRGENVVTFAQEVGFVGSRKKKQLATILSYREKIQSFRYKKYLDAEGFFWDRVEYAHERKQQRVFDITVPAHHSFVANGIVTHNSTSAIDSLKKLHLPAMETPFTNSYKALIYKDLLEEINNGRVHIYGIEADAAYDWVHTMLMELQYLQRIMRGDVITYHHPSSGPVQHDDFSDVAAQLVSLLKRFHLNQAALLEQLRKSGMGPVRLGRAYHPLRGPRIR